MKVGLFLSAPPGYSETFFKSKIEGLQKNGIEVRLFCYYPNPEFTLCPVTESPQATPNKLLQSWRFIREFGLLLPYLVTVIRYINLERKEGTDWFPLFKRIYLNANLLKMKLDWLHFGFTTLALGNETVAKAIGAKMAVSFRGFDMTVYPIKNPDCYAKLWKYLDKVHTISMSLLALARTHGMPKNIPYLKIPPAIEVESFNSLKRNFSYNNKPVFLTTGRLHWIKGFIPTLEALALLKNQGFDFTYKIIGEGEEYERIAFAAYQLGLKDYVQFLGKISHDQVKNELEEADIYLQYSHQEGFCNSVLEAQAMGKLCIVSNAEGLTENVVHEQTGWVILKNSPNLLAAQIKKVLLLDERTKVTVAQNAVERVRRKFNLEKQQREFVEFYSVETSA